MNLITKTKANKNNKIFQTFLTQPKSIDESKDWGKNIYEIWSLTEIGFSKQYQNLILNVSTQGRRIINCQNIGLFEA
jgi:hypothetical protein